MYSETYGAARFVLKIIIAIGWISVGLGAVLVLVGLSQLGGSSDFNRGMGLGALVPAIALVSAGLIQITVGVVGQAILDQADMTRASLSLMMQIARENGIDVKQAQSAASPSRLSVTERVAAVTDPEANAPAQVSHPDIAPDATPAEIEVYKGQRVEKHGMRWYWNGQKFLNLGKAKAAINASV